MKRKLDEKIIRNYLATIGRRGGKKSKRRLSSADARQMTLVREARKAYKKYYFECFWSFDPEIVITKQDISWVAEYLMKYGSRNCWKVGRKLCQ